MQRYNNDRKLNAGRGWVNLVSRLLSHLVIILSCVFVVLLVCDMFLKGEMSFIANPLSKLMLLAMCLTAGINSMIQLSCLYKLRSLRRYRRLRARKR